MTVTSISSVFANKMLLKVVLVLCTSSFVLGILNLNIRGNAPWFQGNSNNRIRDTFMLGVLKGKNSACNGTGGFAAVEGTCKPQKECRKQGGTSSGTCALVGMCCIMDNTCGNTTRSKISYFSSPAAFQSSCSLTVQLFSPNVCQLRLDFEQFSIEGPNTAPLAATCDRDRFTVTGITNLGIDALCGQNAGQHIYIPVNSSMNSAVMLQFQLQAIRDTFLIANPNWRIKITQLECNQNAQDFSSVQSALTTLYQRHQNKKNTPRNDQDLIAPPGCLQYYPEPTGTYESFNYNNGQGQMLANTNYAICFNRGPSICGITHRGDAGFSMSVNDDGTCFTPTEDWLFIPGGSTGTNMDLNYFCGIDLAETTTTSYANGPLYVGVNTDNNPFSNIVDIGFRIAYNTLNSCPPLVPVVRVKVKGQDKME